MAYRHSPFTTFCTICAMIVSPVIGLGYRIVDAVFRAVMLIPPRFDWRMVRQLGVVAFLKIADLKPVYRDSYETHGLSLHGRARC